MEERLKFISAYLEEGWSMTELSRAFGVSRKTAYKFLERYEAHGLEGLKDLSRAPRNHPNQTDASIERLIVAARQRPPFWGAKKLLASLSRQHPEIRWPARSTVGEILKRHGLVAPRQRRRKSTPSRTLLHEPTKPNALWCCDFKGWFKTQDGSRCDPLTVTDAFSRYALVCRGLARPIHRNVRPWFERAFREFGLPDSIRSDNGPPFASSGTAGLTKLSVWWIKMGIRPERITPGRPQENGKHERFHRTLKQETARPPRASLRAQQLAFTRFLHEYNEERPHESLEDRTPSDLYRPSTRPYPKESPGPFEYDPHFEVRNVRPDGRVRWQGKLLFVTDLLYRERVGFEPISDRHWILHFGPLELGIVDNAKNKLCAHGNLTFTRRRADWDEEG